MRIQHNLLHYVDKTEYKASITTIDFNILFICNPPSYQIGHIHIDIGTRQIEIKTK
jgi:hypothetical protein